MGYNNNCFQFLSRIHNLKFFTWVEQQGKTVEELNEQWYNDNYFIERLETYKELDERIKEFNEKVWLIKNYR